MPNRATWACADVWSADGVSKDPGAGLPFTGDTSGIKVEESLLGLVGIGHANVEMHLPGYAGSGQRRDPFGDPLESQLAKAGLGPMTTQPPVSSLTAIPSAWH